ncbi:protein of unknown function DUF1080 [Paraglaciecola sp. T6c]|uniref:3-keto-disaccharide hydrolase n=1 Tax=Pseudoalteromonas atlantica (strain T6c / ATCC BAA-1087) TaxID=3042615 RepID=UPI00005C6131|nr:DUF1080 domain-containing protein [Paraglaciecola sp. T6c]ABG39339.1 protein of unknown function DUF1080 [Paraglaciecola sp. T6c]
MNTLFHSPRVGYQLCRFGAVCSVLLLSACSPTDNTTKQAPESQWRYLLDSELSQWNAWMGVPHSSVKGLPEGTHQADNLNVNGDPSDAMGLNADVKSVFSVSQEQQPVLHVSGEIYGGLTSKLNFENYHLSLQVKWGDKKWAPRLEAKRDSGLLFHCQGEHGAFWKVWKACQELQIQESDFGDYIPLAGPGGTIRSTYKDGQQFYDPNSQERNQVGGYSHAYLEPDYQHGNWNTVELYALADSAVFVVNGEVVMVVTDSINEQGEPLTSGQLQLQSEGAEVFFRDVKIRPIQAFPNHIVREAHL